MNRKIHWLNQRVQPFQRAVSVFFPAKFKIRVENCHFGPAIIENSGGWLEPLVDLIYRTGTAQIWKITKAKGGSNKHPKQPPGMVLKPCKWWDIYHIKWLTGFLNHQPDFPWIMLQSFELVIYHDLRLTDSPLCQWLAGVAKISCRKTVGKWSIHIWVLNQK